MTADSRKEGNPKHTPNSLNTTLNTGNLLYDSDDIQVYMVPGTAATDILSVANGDLSRFVQRHDWRITRYIENIKEELLSDIFARLQALEERLERWEQVISCLEGAEDKHGRENRI